MHKSPITHSRQNINLLVIVAIATLLVWFSMSFFSFRITHQYYDNMLIAACKSQIAGIVIRSAKERLGLLMTEEIDPNRTGLIGPEYSTITTSLGILEAKRTTTNPDLAAAFVRIISRLNFVPGDAIVLVLSGSFPGANIASIMAVESLGLKPIIVHSLGSSMFGATDPEFNWLEIYAELFSKGILDKQAGFVVLGGDGSAAVNMESAGVTALRASVQRIGIQLLEKRPTSALIDAVEAEVNGLLEPGRTVALLNVGGSLIGLGTCMNSDKFPVGIIRKKIVCQDGIPGLMVRFSNRGIPIIHALNIRSLAKQWNLPYDPQPLPTIGNNLRVYGN